MYVSKKFMIPFDSSTLSDFVAKRPNIESTPSGSRHTLNAATCERL